MVRKWIQKYERIAYRCESEDAKKRSTGSGRQTVNVDLENAVYEWIIDKRVAPMQSTELIFEEWRWESIKKMMFLNLSKLPIIE